MESQANNANSRWMILFIGLVVVGVVFMLSLGSALLWMNACGGDGGVPYSAPASPMAEACRVSNSDSFIGWLGIASLVGLLLAPIDLVIAIALRKTKVLLIAAVIAIGINVALIAMPMTLEHQCTAAEWEKLPTRECRTYGQSGP